jgi:cadmium resistance protein CadD (predicted permease)
MESFIVTVGIGIVAFVVTDLDDLLVLVGFFADPSFRPWQIVAGQFGGIAILYGLSVAASFASLILPTGYIGLLGLVPIIIGFMKLVAPEVAGEEPPEHGGAAVSGLSPPGNVVAVAAVTVANGGDNIATYAPLFAGRPGEDVVVIGLVFVAMTAAWCAVARWLVRHRTLGRPLRKYGGRVLPHVLVWLGVLILWRSHTLATIWSDSHADRWPFSLW